MPTTNGAPVTDVPADLPSTTAGILGQFARELREQDLPDVLVYDLVREAGNRLLEDCLAVMAVTA